MVQGLLQLLGSYPLLFEKELANADGHESKNSTLPMMTIIVNS